MYNTPFPFSPTFFALSRHSDIKAHGIKPEEMRTREIGARRSVNNNALPLPIDVTLGSAENLDFTEVVSPCQAIPRAATLLLARRERYFFVGIPKLQEAASGYRLLQSLAGRLSADETLIPA